MTRSSEDRGEASSSGSNGASEAARRVTFVMRFLRQLHRWVGLIIAAIVLAVAASGGLLLLREPYYRAVYPSLAAPVTPRPATAHADAMTAIESRWGAEGLRLIKFPRPGTNAFLLWFTDGSEAFVDPATAGLIARWYWSSDVVAFLFELHAHLLSDPAGTIVNGITALIVVFMGLTGIVLWWPRRRGTFPLRSAMPRTVRPGEILRSHAAAGVLALLPITLFVVTGAAIVFYDEVAAVMTAWFDSRAPQEPDARVLPRDAAHRPWVEILDTLDRTLPDGETVFFYPGTPSDARLMFRKRVPGEWHPNGRSYVVIDPYTATVVQTIDARAQGTGTRLMHAVYPVHAAKVGGEPMTAMAGATALVLSWLAIGGVWTYVGRR